MKNKKNELSIKSKLLFNNLDMHYRNAIDLNIDIEKRKRSVDNIFSVYRMTLKPFIVDEPEEYISKVNRAIDDKQEERHRMICERTTVETLVLYISPILEHLKDMIKTCKMNLDTLNALWKI